jgi:hypothetical protein
MNQFATYTKFYAPEDAQFLVTLLQQHNIPYTLDHEVNQLDKVYIGEALDAMFVLSIPADRFNDVNGLFAEMAKNDMAQPGFEHYLQDYSAAELKDILEHPADWNAYDIQVAATLLSTKEDTPIAAPINNVDAYTPTKLDSAWIVLGYLACLTGLTTFFILGAVGFFAGLSLVQAKRRLKNGETVKMFTEANRRHGRAMMVLSILCTGIGFGLLVYRYR